MSLRLEKREKGLWYNINKIYILFILYHKPFSLFSNLNDIRDIVDIHDIFSLNKTFLLDKNIYIRLKANGLW